MNQLSGVDRLANTFSVMRHAQSKANVAGIIVSRIENDRRGDYGLTGPGRQQALAAAQDCGLPPDTLIYASGFARARQTAEAVRAHLGAPEIVIADALRERCFGHWEGSPVTSYAHVWAADETDPEHADGDVEPAAAVLDRATGFVADLERRHRGRNILLVSHGDTLQILQAGFLGVDPSRHRSLPHLGTAEIRLLHLGEAVLQQGPHQQLRQPFPQRLALSGRPGPGHYLPGAPAGQGGSCPRLEGLQAQLRQPGGGSVMKRQPGQIG
jgi:broad specificity phosphatase PhoE